MVANNDVNSFVDLLHLTNKLQQDLKDVETEQKQIYSNHGIEKRKCKEFEDFEKFRSNELEYKRKLEALKERKGKIKEQIQNADRCYNKESSRVEEELERMLPVGDMEDIDDIYDVEVPENPYKEVTVETENVFVEEAIDPAVGTILIIALESLNDMKTELVIENISAIDMEHVDELLEVPKFVLHDETDIALAIGYNI